MSRYTYIHALDEYTAVNLKNYTASDWKRAVYAILENRAIEPNVDFTDSMVLTRLFELYNLIVTHNLDKRAYQKAVVDILLEYYEQRPMVTQTLQLIKTVDHIQPSEFYPPLELMLTSPGSDSMYQLISPEGFPIPYHLINTLLNFNTDGGILTILKSKINEEPPPVYYQLMIRYLYTYKINDYFAEFMTKIFSRILNEEIFRYILLALDEYSHEKRSFHMIFHWIFSDKKKLKSNYSVLYRRFCAEMLDSMNSQENILSKYAMFYHLYSFLKSQVMNQLTKGEIENVLTEPNNINMYSFMFYLGTKNPAIKMKVKPEFIKFLFLDQTTAEISLAYKEEMDNFVMGIKSGVIKDTVENNVPLSIDQALLGII